jgi:hypothetical protein
MEKQLTIFEFKDAVTELVFGKQTCASDNQPYSHEEVIDRLKDMVATQTLIIPITQCDVDEFFTPLVNDGITFDWSLTTEDGTPINMEFVDE